MNPSTVSIKTEGVEQSKPSTSIEKPKFFPVARKKPLSEPSSSSVQNNHENPISSLSSSSSSSLLLPMTVADISPKATMFHQTRNDVRKGNQRERGKSKWLLPTGEAFFTGNSSLQTKSFNSNLISADTNTSTYQQSMEIKSEIPKTKSRNITIKVEPLSHNSKQSQNSNLETSVNGFNNNDSDNGNDDNDDSDSDGYENDIITNTDGAIEGEENEVWPPKSYDPHAPLTLPFGPRTTTTLTQLASLPILADPNDQAAMKHEELNSTFLIQMPSDLRLRPKIVSKTTSLAYIDPFTGDDIKDTSTGPMEIDEAPTTESLKYLQNGQLGKLRLMKSGKIYLVTNEGLKFEVWSGMRVAFAQYIASITLPSAVHPPNTSTGEGMHISIPSVSNGVGKNRPSTKNLKTGDFHLITGVTRKLVISPSYLIGKTQSEMPSSSSRQSGPGHSTSSSIGLVGFPDDVFLKTKISDADTTSEFIENKVGLSYVSSQSIFPEAQSWSFLHSSGIRDDPTEASMQGTGAVNSYVQKEEKKIKSPTRQSRSATKLNRIKTNENSNVSASSSGQYMNPSGSTLKQESVSLLKPVNTQSTLVPTLKPSNVSPTGILKKTVIKDEKISIKTELKNESILTFTIPKSKSSVSKPKSVTIQESKSSNMDIIYDDLENDR